MKLIGLSGSLRAGSYNHFLLREARDRLSDTSREVEFVVTGGNEGFVLNEVTHATIRDLASVLWR